MVPELGRTTWPISPLHGPAHPQPSSGGAGRRHFPGQGLLNSPSHLPPAPLLQARQAGALPSCRPVLPGTLAVFIPSLSSEFCPQSLLPRVLRSLVRVIYNAKSCHTVHAGPVPPPCSSGLRDGVVRALAAARLSVDVACAPRLTPAQAGSRPGMDLALAGERPWSPPSAWGP